MMDPPFQKSWIRPWYVFPILILPVTMLVGVPEVGCPPHGDLNQPLLADPGILTTRLSTALTSHFIPVVEKFGAETKTGPGGAVIGSNCAGHVIYTHLNITPYWIGLLLVECYFCCLVPSLFFILDCGVTFRCFLGAYNKDLTYPAITIKMQLSHFTA